MIDGARIQERLDLLGISQAELARRVNLRQSTINGLVKGGQRTSGYLHIIARELQTTPEYLNGETDVADAGVAAAPPKQPVVPTGDNDDEVEIASLDMAYGMGGTFLDHDGAIEVEKLKFSRKWVERFTHAPAQFLFVAEGKGDSMAPTINDCEMVLVDRSDRIPKDGDLIWAIAFGGVGMFKRLRPMPDGTMKIMSDNPNVSDERATDGELFIVGRVITVFRNL